MVYGCLRGCWRPSSAGPGPGRAKVRVCSDVERAWPGGARGGEGRGPARGGPAVGAGPAEAEESRTPASGGEEVCGAGAGGERWGCPWWGSEGPTRRAPPATGEGREMRVSELLSIGQGAARWLSVPRGFMGGRGPLEAAAGEKEAAFLPKNKEPGAWPRGRPPLLPEACPRRLR